MNQRTYLLVLVPALIFVVLYSLTANRTEAVTSWRNYGESLTLLSGWTETPGGWSPAFMHLLREDKGRVVYGLTGNIHGARGTGTVRIATIRNASDNASEQFALVCKANFVVAGYRADTNENIAVVVHLQPDTSGNGIGIYIPSSTLSEMSSDATLYLVLDSILLSESHLSGFIANNNGCT